MIVWISKIAGAFLVPPGLFAALLILAAILLFLGKRRSGLTVLVTSLLLVYLLSISPVQNLLLGPLEQDAAGAPGSPAAADAPNATDYSGAPAAAASAGAPQNSSNAPEYIVVLGGGTVPASPMDAGGSAGAGQEAAGRETAKAAKAPDAPAPIFLARLLHAARLHHLYELPVIVSGGIVYPKEGSGAESESASAARVLSDLGVPESSIILEEQSRSTWQNARYSSDIVGDAPVYLVTSAVHMKRALLSFREFGLEAVPEPSNYSYAKGPFGFEDYLPGSGNLYASSAALHEYLGLLFYSLRSILHR